MQSRSANKHCNTACVQSRSANKHCNTAYMQSRSANKHCNTAYMQSRSANSHGLNIYIKGVEGARALAPTLSHIHFRRMAYNPQGHMPARTRGSHSYNSLDNMHSLKPQTLIVERDHKDNHPPVLEGVVHIHVQKLGFCKELRITSTLNLNTDL